MRKIGSILTFLAGLAFFATAVLHLTGYGSILEMLDYMTAELQLVVPALWLMFSAMLTVLALILFVVAIRPGPGGPSIVLLAALGPLAAAGLLARGIRLGGPVPILLGDTALALLAAAVLALQVRLARPKPEVVSEVEHEPVSEEPNE
jgi:hypothetical protein